MFTDNFNVYKKFSKKIRTFRQSSFDFPKQHKKIIIIKLKVL